MPRSPQSATFVVTLHRLAWSPMDEGPLSYRHVGALFLSACVARPGEESVIPHEHRVGPMVPRSPFESALVDAPGSVGEDRGSAQRVEVMVSGSIT